MSVKIQVKQLTSGSQIYGKHLISNGLGGFTYNGSVLTGNTFPLISENGDLFYRTDFNQLYHYDNSRSKWLSVDISSFICGRSSILNNTSAYMNIGTSVMTSTDGLYMKQNGTILSASVDNTNIMGADRNIEIRINNSTINKIVITVGTGNKSASTTTENLDFNTGDLIQVIAISNDTTDFDNITVIFDVAWRT